MFIEEKIPATEETPVVETQAVEPAETTDAQNENQETANCSDDINKAEKADSDNNEVAEEDNFGELLEKTFTETAEVNQGDEISGTIVNISDAYIFIGLGEKNEAIADVAEYKNQDGELPFKVGDTIKGFVVKKTDSETIVSKRLSKGNVSKEALRDAYERKIPVSGKVEKVVKGGFVVNVLNARAFCPVSQINSFPVSDQNQFVGKTYDFRIIDFEEKGKNIVISRRVLLEEEKMQLKEETLKKLEVGLVLKGKISRVTDFGAFVDIGGVEGLVHISEFAWKRIDSAYDFVKSGDDVDVKVIKLQGERISLSMKQLTPNPIDEALGDLKEGQVVNCKIVKNEKFGSFAEIKPGVQGLIPISEMRRGGKVNHPSEVVQIGDMVEVEIIRVNTDTRKISMSMKALQPDPWENITEYINEGMVVDGFIDGIAEFGIFVRIKDGITGLVPKSKLKIAGLDYHVDDIGSDIKVRVVEVNTDRKRISLEPSDMPAQEVRETTGSKENWKKYASQRWDEKSDNPFSSL